MFSFSQESPDKRGNTRGAVITGGSGDLAIGSCFTMFTLLANVGPSGISLTNQRSSARFQALPSSINTAQSCSFWENSKTDFEEAKPAARRDVTIHPAHDTIRITI